MANKRTKVAPKSSLKTINSPERVVDHPKNTKKTKPLDLGLEPEEIQSKDEKAQYFVEKWKSRIDPYNTYKDYFDNVDESSTLLRFVREFYKTFVIKNGWEEEKYVNVLHRIFTSGSLLTSNTISRFGIRWDREEQARKARGARR